MQNKWEKPCQPQCRALLAALAGQAGIDPHIAATSELCKQDGWCAARGWKLRRTAQNLVWITPDKLNARLHAPSHLPIIVPTEGTHKLQSSGLFTPSRCKLYQLKDFWRCSLQSILSQCGCWRAFWERLLVVLSIQKPRQHYITKLLACVWVW